MDLNIGSIISYCMWNVDHCLCISANAKYVLRNEIGKYFKLKEELIGPQNIYLGGKMQQVEITNGTLAWLLSSSQYVQAAVKNIETYLIEMSLKFPKGKAKAEAPFTYQ